MIPMLWEFFDRLRHHNSFYYLSSWVHKIQDEMLDFKNEVQSGFESAAVISYSCFIQREQTTPIKEL